MDAVDRLQSLERIKRLKATHFRTMDAKDWAGLADVFTADVVLDARGAMEAPEPEDALDVEGLLPGRYDVLAYMSEGLAAITNVHHGQWPLRRGLVLKRSTKGYAGPA